MNIKCFLFLATLFINSCQITGSYKYTKESLSEKHKNETVLAYKGKINQIDYKIYNKINFDPNNTDRPPYYETSYEIWFW